MPRDPDDPLSTLTREQWRQARQAGSATTTDGRVLDVIDHGEQLMLPGTGPQGGGQYVNRGTGQIATILRVSVDSGSWVTIRTNGREKEIQLSELEEYWQPR